MGATLASMIAYLSAQSIDKIFSLFKSKTGNKKWGRNNVSTPIIQFVDSQL